MIILIPRIINSIKINKNIVMKGVGVALISLSTKYNSINCYAYESTVTLSFCDTNKLTI